MNSKQKMLTTGGGALALMLAFLWGSAHPISAQPGTVAQKVLFQTALPNVAGKQLTAMVVTFPPGVKSPPHQHAGSVFVYVLSGKLRSENSATGPAAEFSQGSTFFEPEGSQHLQSENVSKTEPAQILAIFIADQGAQLTRPAARTNPQAAKP